MIEAATVGALATLLAPLYIMVFKLNRQVGEMCSTIKHHDARIDRNTRND